jgi:XRE family transcriptional regulator, regulator of sulfur utilization
MITKRDIAVALITVCGTVGVGAAALAPPAPPTILGPTVFDWNKMVPVKTAVGEVRSLTKGPTATVDELEMHITTLNAGQTSHPPHKHVNEELIIIREGECETLSDGKWVHVGPGSVVFNASNSLHGFRNVGTTPATYHVINWSPNKEMAAKDAPAKKSGE